MAPDFVLVLPAQSFENHVCRASVQNPAHGLFLLTVHGRYTRDIADCVVRVMDELRPQAPLALFADFESLDSYESRSRMLMTEWCATHRHEIRQLHALTKPGIVRMGVATAAMTLSLVRLRLISHSSRHSFARAYEEHTRAAS